MTIESHLIDLWITFVSGTCGSKNLGEKAYEFTECLKSAKVSFDLLGPESYINRLQDDAGSEQIRDCFLLFHAIGSENHENEVELARSDYLEMIVLVLSDINFTKFDYEWLIMEYHNRA